MTDVDETIAALAAIDELGDRLSALAEVITKPATMTVDCEQVLSLARRAVTGAAYADLLAWRGGDLVSLAATRPFPHDLDRIRSETGEGPCYGALEQATPVVSDQLADDDRWPVFGEQTVQITGVRSMLSCRVSLANRRHGVLSFYSDWPHGFDPASVAVGKLAAAYCSLAAVTGQLG